MTLLGIVMAQVGNGFAMRTHRQSILAVGFFTNKLRWWGLAGELLGVAALMYVPFLQKIFSTAPLSLAGVGSDGALLTGAPDSPTRYASSSCDDSLANPMLSSFPRRTPARDMA